jgi:hypothetical protein
MNNKLRGQAIQPIFSQKWQPGKIFFSKFPFRLIQFKEIFYKAEFLKLGGSKLWL